MQILYHTYLQNNINKQIANIPRRRTLCKSKPYCIIMRMSERVDYTAPEVLANPLADPPDPNQVDFSQRPSMFGEPELEPETGRPINPYATPDMPRGRGELWQWWVNHTETSVVLHNYAPGRYAILLVERADTGQWSLPGGFVDPGEAPGQTAPREVLEEAGVDLSNVPHMVMGPFYARDPRNTRNAHIEDRLALATVHHAQPPIADGQETRRARWASLDEARDLYASHDELVDEVRERLEKFDSTMKKAQEHHNNGRFAEAQDTYRQAIDILPDPLARGRAMRGAVASASRQPEPQDRSKRAMQLANLSRSAQGALDEQQCVLAYTPDNIPHVVRDIAQSKTVRGSIDAHRAVTHEEDGSVSIETAKNLGKASLGWFREAYQDLLQTEGSSEYPDQHRINLVSRLALAEALYGDKHEARKVAKTARKLAPMSERPDNPTSAQLSAKDQKKAQQRAKARAAAASLIAWMPGIGKNTPTRKVALKLAATKAGF